MPDETRPMIGIMAKAKTPSAIVTSIRLKPRGNRASGRVAGQPNWAGITMPRWIGYMSFPCWTKQRCCCLKIKSAKLNLVCSALRLARPFWAVWQKARKAWSHRATATAQHAKRSLRISNSRRRHNPFLKRKVAFSPRCGCHASVTHTQLQIDEPNARRGKPAPLQWVWTMVGDAN